MKLFIFICLIVTQVLSLDISSIQTPVYKEIKIAYDIKDINEAIISQKKFKTAK